MNAIFQRTSVRQYQKKLVEEEKVQKILQAAMAAPSAGNQQPWEYYVVTDGNLLEQLAKCSPYAGCTAGAPLAFVACFRENIPMPEYAQIDLSASVENLLLEAQELKLGAVWLGIAPLIDRMEQVKKVLDMPDNLRPFAIIPCGYPMSEKSQVNRFDENRVHWKRRCP